MASMVGPALGIVAQTFAQRLAEKQKTAHDDEAKRFEMISKMVQSGMESGAVDPNQAMQFMMENAPGGKKGKGQNDAPWKNLVGGIIKAGGQSQAQSPSMPTFLTADQLAAKKEQQAIDLKKREQTEITGPAEEAKEARLHKYKMEEEEEKAKHLKGVPDKQPHQNPDGSWSLSVRDPVNGAVIYEQPAQPPTAKTPLQKEAEEVQALYPGMDPGRVKQVAAVRIQERTDREYNLKRDRALNGLALSRARLALDQEKFAETKEMFPILMATRAVNLDIANARSAIEKYKQEHPAVAAGIPDREAHMNADGSWSISVRARDGSGKVLYEQPADATGSRIAINEGRFDASQGAAGAKASAAAMKSSAAVIKEATVLTEQAYRSESGIEALAQNLGMGTSKSAYLRNLVKEMTGREYEDVLEEAQGAAPATTTPTPPPSGGRPPVRPRSPSTDGKPPTAPKHQVDDVVISKTDGKRHKITSIDADGQLHLDPNPLP